MDEEAHCKIPLRRRGCFADPSKALLRRRGSHNIAVGICVVRRRRRRQQPPPYCLRCTDASQNAYIVVLCIKVSRVSRRG